MISDHNVTANEVFRIYPNVFIAAQAETRGREHATRRAACCGGADRKGSEAPLQRPDAPQRRPGGSADSAGAAEGLGGGGQIQVRGPLGEPRLSPP